MPWKKFVVAYVSFMDDTGVSIEIVEAVDVYDAVKKHSKTAKHYEFGGEELLRDRYIPEYDDTYKAIEQFFSDQDAGIGILELP